MMKAKFTPRGDALGPAEVETEAVEIEFGDCDGRRYTLLVSIPEDTFEHWTKGAVCIDLTYRAPDGSREDTQRFEEVVQ